jgi:hypothetical protein
MSFGVSRATLGALDNVRMDPVTDHTLAMAALVGVDSKTGLTLKRARWRMPRWHSGSSVHNLAAVDLMPG